MSPGRLNKQAHETADQQQRQRLDKYLWFARVVKTRTLAAKLVRDGDVRVNSERVTSPSKMVAPSDTLTIALDRTVRVLKILAPGARRGPFDEARLLYEEFLEESANTGPGKTAPDKAEAKAYAGEPDADKTRPDKRLRRIGALLKRNQ